MKFTTNSLHKDKGLYHYYKELNTSTHTQKDDRNESCIRGLKRFELGQNFNLWAIHFYNEMEQRDYHHYFPYNKRTKAYTASIVEEREKELKELTPEDRESKKTEYMKESMVAQGYLERCLTAETV